MLSLQDLGLDLQLVSEHRSQPVGGRVALFYAKLGTHHTGPLGPQYSPGLQAGPSKSVSANPELPTSIGHTEVINHITGGKGIETEKSHLLHQRRS